MEQHYGVGVMLKSLRVFGGLEAWRLGGLWILSYLIVFMDCHSLTTGRPYNFAFLKLALFIPTQCVTLSVGSPVSTTAREGARND